MQNPSGQTRVVPDPSDPAWIASEQLLVILEVTFRNEDMPAMLIPTASENNHKLSDIVIFP